MIAKILAHITHLAECKRNQVDSKVLDKVWIRSTVVRGQEKDFSVSPSGKTIYVYAKQLAGREEVVERTINITEGVRTLKSEK